MSVIGMLIVFVIYAIEITFFRYLASKLSGNKKRWFILTPLIVVGIALPIADEVWISWNFHKLCKTAGVTVERKAEVDGFYVDVGGWGYSLIKEYGYQFMEHKSNIYNKVSRVELRDGEWIETELSAPTARYHYKKSRNEDKVSHKIRIIERIVFDTETNEVIGKDRRYKRYPGWVDFLWIRFFDAGPRICRGFAPTPPALRHTLYHYVLSPTTENNLGS